MSDETAAERVERLARELAAARLEADAEERVCSVCGMAEEDSEWGFLFDIRVIVADGEEGFADILQLLCDDHWRPVATALIALGFKDHRHGGANFLEDPECPGSVTYGACPTPQDNDAEFPILVSAAPGPQGDTEAMSDIQHELEEVGLARKQILVILGPLKPWQREAVVSGIYLHDLRQRTEPTASGGSTTREEDMVQ